MRRTFRTALSLVPLVVILATAATAAAGAGPAYLADRRAGGPDPRAILWESKQAAFEKLEAALALPETAARASQDDYDARYYDLDLAIDATTHTISGTVVIRATSNVDGLTSVVLDFYDNMVVDVVMLQTGAPAVYTHANDLLTVTLGSPANTGDTFELTVVYHGTPVNDAIDFSTHGGGNPIISSLSEPIGAREWWPCKDTPADKADSARIALTVDDALVAASNGTLVSVVDNGATKTYTWKERHPITTYLISFAVTNYSHWTDTYTYSRGTMPIENYVYPEILSEAQEDLNITADAIGFYASIFGEYPFVDEKYGHAIFPWAGGMEHQTCTSYGRVLIRGDHYYDWILVHELSHEWWGDWVTCATWDDIWLNEGFASYCEALWYEHIGGQSGYDDYIDGFDYYGYFNGPIYAPEETFGRTVYDKGALVLHMLRRVLELENGTRAHYPLDALLGVLAQYRADHGGDSAVTADFQAECEAAYGGSLDWFFQPWVYGENRPVYEYSWVASDQGPPYGVMLHVDQVQTDAGLFTMPIDVEIETTAGDTLVTVWNDQWGQDFFIDVDAQPTGLSFDPYNWILKDVTEVSTGAPSGAPALSLSVPANPTGPDARLSFTLPASGRVDLRIYDVAGRLVRTLVDGELPAGGRSVVWDGRAVTGSRAASGVYFVRLGTAEGSVSRKLVLAR
jgi:aminopeptidase N